MRGKYIFKIKVKLRFQVEKRLSKAFRFKYDVQVQVVHQVCVLYGITSTSVQLRYTLQIIDIRYIVFGCYFCISNYKYIYV